MYPQVAKTVPSSALMPCDPGLLACGMRLSVRVMSSAICVEVFRDSCTGEWSNWVSVVNVHRLDLFRDAGAVMAEHVRKPIAPPLSRTRASVLTFMVLAGMCSSSELVLSKEVEKTNSLLTRDHRGPSLCPQESKSLVGRMHTQRNPAVSFPSQLRSIVCKFKLCWAWWFANWSRADAC